MARMGSTRHSCAATPAHRRPGPQTPEGTLRRHRPVAIGLLCSLLIHALVLSLSFGEGGFGLPGFALPWSERRVEVPALHIVLAPRHRAPETPVAAVAETPEPPRLVQAPPVPDPPGLLAVPPLPPVPPVPPLPLVALASTATTSVPLPPMSPLPPPLYPGTEPPPPAVPELPPLAPPVPAPAAVPIGPDPAPAAVLASLPAVPGPLLKPVASLPPLTTVEPALSALALDAPLPDLVTAPPLAPRVAAAEAAAASSAPPAPALATEAAAVADAARLAAEREVEARRQAAAQREAQRLAAIQAAQARREAVLKAIGRQLDEEADRRDAAAAAALQPGAGPAASRRGRLWGRTDSNTELVRYAEAWALKIQLNTPVETVRRLAQQPHTAPMVTVALRSDGSVESVSFVVSSGVPGVDDAVRQIIEARRPYATFPPALARDYDVVEIRRTWTFDSAMRLY